METSVFNKPDGTYTLDSARDRFTPFPVEKGPQGGTDVCEGVPLTSVDPTTGRPFEILRVTASMASNPNAGAINTRLIYTIGAGINTANGSETKLVLTSLKIDGELHRGLGAFANAAAQTATRVGARCIIFRTKNNCTSTFGNSLNTWQDPVNVTSDVAEALFQPEDLIDLMQWETDVINNVGVGGTMDRGAATVYNSPVKRVRKFVDPVILSGMVFSRGDTINIRTWYDNSNTHTKSTNPPTLTFTGGVGWEPYVVLNLTFKFEYL